MQVIKITLPLVSFRRFTENWLVKFTVEIAYNGHCNGFHANPAAIVPHAQPRSEKCCCCVLLLLSFNTKLSYKRNWICSLSWGMGLLPQQRAFPETHQKHAQL